MAPRLKSTFMALDVFLIWKMVIVEYIEKIEMKMTSFNIEDVDPSVITKPFVKPTERKSPVNK